jgi:dihydroxy-acid dehydratase
MGFSSTCALVTDGRFSGTNRGCFVGHISPEAYESGDIALVEDGDIITIDIPGRLIRLDIRDKELRTRRKRWKRPEKTVGNAIRAGMGAKESFEKYEIM